METSLQESNINRIRNNNTNTQSYKKLETFTRSYNYNKFRQATTGQDVQKPYALNHKDTIGAYYAQTTPTPTKYGAAIAKPNGGGYQTKSTPAWAYYGTSTGNLSDINDGVVNSPAPSEPTLSPGAPNSPTPGLDPNASGPQSNLFLYVILFGIFLFLILGAALIKMQYAKRKRGFNGIGKNGKLVLN